MPRAVSSLWSPRSAHHSRAAFPDHIALGINLLPDIQRLRADLLIFAKAMDGEACDLKLLGQGLCIGTPLS